MKAQILVIGLFCILQAAVSEIDYVDCGSSFEITSVQIENCTTTPCLINIGATREVIVNTRNLVPEIDDLKSMAFITFMGQRWHLSVTPDTPCIDWGCPLKECMPRTYKGDILFYGSLIRRPATVTLKTTFDTSTGTEIAFCISFSVELI